MVDITKELRTLGKSLNFGLRLFDPRLPFAAHHSPRYRHHVPVPRRKARHWLLRQDPQHSRPHEAQGLRRERARTVRAFVSSLRTTTDQDRNRQALRYIIRNTTLPQRVRAQAQLQLSQMHCYTRFTQVKNRCIMGGKGRGVFSDFRLGRVRVPKNQKLGSSADNFHSTSSVSTHLLETCPV